MSYTKHTWFDDLAGGTPVTAAKLNEIEDGIEGAHTHLENQGLLAAIPAAGNAGRLYFATDKKVLYRDNGTDWDVVPTTDTLGAAGTFLKVNAAGDGLEYGNATYSADEIAATPAGNLAGATVEAQLYELDTEKAATGHTHAASGATVVHKTADESVTSSTTLQDDDALLLAVAANETWLFEVELLVGGGTTGDFQAAFSFPSGATVTWAPHGPAAASAGTGDGQWLGPHSGTPTNAIAFGLVSVNEPTLIVIRGRIANGATPGNLQLRWAQNASNATATTVRAGSRLIARSV